MPTGLTGIKNRTGTEKEVAQQRNLLVMLGVLAERHAGPASEALFCAELADCLFTFLQSELPIIQLHALLAIEKFAKTRSNKRLLMDIGIAKYMVKLEKDLCSAAGIAARKFVV